MVKAIGLLLLLLLSHWAFGQHTDSIISIKPLSSAVNSNREETFPIPSFNADKLYFARYDGGGHNIYVSQRKSSEFDDAKPYALLNKKSNNAIVGVDSSGKSLFLLNKTNGEMGITKAIFSTTSANPTYEDLDFYCPKNSSGIHGFWMSPNEEIAFMAYKRDSIIRRDMGYEILMFKKSGTRWRYYFLRGINTMSNEISPFLDSDSTLYFASDRKDGKGGYDIYYSRPTNESLTKWSEPKNLTAVNSEKFDAYFIKDQNGSAYFSSNRNSDLADIFVCEFARKIDAISLGDTCVIPELDTLKTTLITSEIEKTGQSAPKNVFFSLNSAELTDSAIQVLNVLIDVLKTNDEIKVELRGYSDSLGNANYNLILSKERSVVVKNHLAAQGINDERITTVGAGMTSPLGDNSSKTGRAKNRRVRIILFKPKN
jgi:outer membrane protein OmpA-like peptidoglycan-associated protein